ncbi:MAG TPA: sigma-70 family RNA polymerase sigma factor [Candidatus Marinimicrobia bacterium]|nr:sigma-70 family RNA polymerase sigma factor [Candidatus Neomarinimicrobiota bacterium]
MTIVHGKNANGQYRKSFLTSASLLCLKVRNDMQNDHELIQEFQEGQDGAFDELVKRHLPSVFGFFINVTRDEMAAEDLAQDVFLKLYKHLKNFRFESAFTTYLYRININTANSWMSRNKWKNLLHLDQAPDRGERDDSAESEWTRRELWDAIGRLPKKQRMVVMMRIAQELPYKDIAEITDMTVGSAKVNYHHAVKKLKELLNDESI